MRISDWSSDVCSSDLILVVDGAICERDFSCRASLSPFMSTCCGPAIVARPNEEESNCGFVPVRIFRLLVGCCTRRKHNGCQDQEDRRASAHFNFLTLVELQPSKIAIGLQF